MPAHASGFYESNVIVLCGREAATTQSDLAKFAMALAKKQRAPRGNASMRLRPSLSLALFITLPPHFRARYARADATSMAGADLPSTSEAWPTFVARGWASGVNVESAK